MKRDSKHDDTQHNNSQHTVPLCKRHIIRVLSDIMLTIIMLGVIIPSASASQREGT